MEAADTIPVIDTHIHLFDPTRPEGVDWPAKEDTALYKPALPDRYRKLALPFGIRGAVVVEASPRLEDNQWVLNLAAKDKLIVGLVGDLEPGKADFPKQLERFHANPLFRGIRYGNIWNRDLAAQVEKPEFVRDVKRLADAGLSLDTANPDVRLVEAAVKITDRVPGLTFVIDHLPQLNPPADTAGLNRYRGFLHELSKRPRVFVKISQVLRRVDGKVPEDLSFYRSRIDEVFAAFGEDRVMFGSDWPNSDQWAPYPKIFGVVHDYFTAKGRPIAEKYFWKNSMSAYHWVKRDPSQDLK